MIDRCPRHSCLVRDGDQTVAQLARRGDSELDPDLILSSLIPVILWFSLSAPLLQVPRVLQLRSFQIRVGWNGSFQVRVS